VVLIAFGQPGVRVPAIVLCMTLVSFVSDVKASVMFWTFNRHTVVWQ
jgi:hypothetical protein